jgi:predicted DNA-binding transcriptional regulator AlpA
MASVHLVSTSPRQFEFVQQDFRSLRPSAVRPMHLIGMGTVNRPLNPPDATQSVVTLSQLADELCVPVKTLYDLRSKGRGPRGFRVGRELRFRRREVDAWLTHLESADARRHPRQDPA